MVVSKKTRDLSWKLAFEQLIKKSFAPDRKKGVRYRGNKSTELTAGAIVRKIKGSAFSPHSAARIRIALAGQSSNRELTFECIERLAFSADVEHVKLLEALELETV